MFRRSFAERKCPDYLQFVHIGSVGIVLQGAPGEEEPDGKPGGYSFEDPS